MNTKIEMVKDDITKISVAAIVNAANETLLGGGGVDGAIHMAAGLGLLEECRGLGGCRVGEAKITKGYKLPAKYVIHTVGPVWRNGGYDEEILLAKCYKNCFGLAFKKRIKSIAFPAISTGAYGFPIAKSAPVALRETIEFVSAYDCFEKVIFVLFSDVYLEAYKYWYGQIVNKKNAY